VGTLFQAALLPGIFLAGLYALYAFGYALWRPANAPAVALGNGGGEVITRNEALTWFLGLPIALIVAAVLAGQAGLIGTQDPFVSNQAGQVERAELRTNVSEQCQAAMIELHGQEMWDRSVAQQEIVSAANASGETSDRTDAEMVDAEAEALANVAPIGTGVAVVFVILGLVLTFARGIVPTARPLPLMIGAVGIALALLTDVLLIGPTTGPGARFLLLAIPFAITMFGVLEAVKRLSSNELLRVVFPPLVLIVAVLGSILGGITNPTPAAALGAAGAIMLAAYRKLKEDQKSPKVILWASFAVVIMILFGVNFDLRMTRSSVPLEDWIAYLIALSAYHFAFFGLLYGCWVLLRSNVLNPVVRETAKVTSMVFTILIGSQLLNLVLISFGGEHYIQSFLRAFDNEVVVFLVVMAILFVLGFVLDFLEIIYIVIPIVGPVIYGGTLEPTWVTIMIAINLQTSFLTPPFGFALFYLRGVAPAGVTTGHIYRGVLPFVLIQVIGLALLWAFPQIVTILPSLL